MSQHSYFQNKNAWITGASSGIGEQLTYLLSQSAAKLVISSRRKEELERVKNACSHPENVSIVLVDLGDENSVKQACAEALQILGHIDLLFNNGGISQRSLALETSMEVNRKIFEINFFSNILISKLVGPEMVKRGSGHIVITSTLLGKWGFHTRSAYSASKHALHGYYDSLRMEVENADVKVTIVTPGFIATDISKNAMDESGNKTGEMDANQAGGMSAAECARRILDGVAAGKKEFGVGGSEMKGLLVKRFFPALFDKILRKRSPK